MASSPTQTTDKTTYARHEKSHPNGGVHLKDDPDSTVNSRAVVLNIIKTMGSKIKEGKVFDLLKTSRPAIISYPKTYLQCVADDLIYTDLIDQAAAARSPVKRMKYLVAFFIAGLHRNACEMGNNGPLNPILGETFIAEKENGTKLYCEQISHHPPVSSYYMVDAAGSYQIYGSGEVNARVSGLNCIEGRRIGQNTVIFKDGGKITIGNAEMIIEGLMMGDRTINHVKSFCFVDAQNEITAEVKFSYNPTGTVTKIASGFKNLFGRKKNQDEKVYNDNFTLEIFSTETSERRVLASGTGEWLSYIEVDGELLWQVSDKIKNKWVENVNGKLDSDSSHRSDSKSIKAKNYDLAQKEKDILENVQRADAKLRKESMKKKATA